MCNNVTPISVIHFTKTTIDPTPTFFSGHVFCVKTENIDLRLCT